MGRPPTVGSAATMARRPGSKLASRTTSMPEPGRTSVHCETNDARGSGSSIRYSVYRPSVVTDLAGTGGGAVPGIDNHSPPDGFRSEGRRAWDVGEIERT